MATVKKVRKSTAPYYGAAAVWIAWAALRDLYRPSHFVFVAVLSLGAFLLLRAVCKDEVTETVVPDPPKEEEKPTGNAELDKMIDDGKKAIAEMKRLDDAIEDEKISQDIRRLEIRKFMNYYLPTTLKLLNAYDRMDGAGISGENVTGTKEKVENIMGTIVTAFEKQLDSLFGADAMDISTDISVLETMLVREGLAGEKMEAQTIKNADGTDIKLEM